MAAGGSHPALSEPWRLLFDIVQWPLDGHPASFDQSARALNAVSGGVMMGWGALMLLLARQPHPPYRALLGGMLVWFVFDSTGSALAGVWGNIVLNIGFALLFAIPLVSLARRTARP